MSFELNEMYNREYDYIAGSHRVADSLSTSKVLIDKSGTTYYVGQAIAGSATSDATKWLIEKIDLSAFPYSFTHATDSWDNRATATYS